MVGWMRTDNRGTGRTRPSRASRPWLTSLVPVALLLGLMVGPVAVSAANWDVNATAYAT